MQLSYQAHKRYESILKATNIKYCLSAWLSSSASI